MISKDFDSIVESDIVELLQSLEQEGSRLDYKRDLPKDNTDDKREFLADISSFANASGGDLFYGIADVRDNEGRTTGQPSLYGLEILNVDELIQRLQNYCDTGISPRIHGIRMKVFRVEEKFVLLIRIPSSAQSPHMVSFRSKGPFYSRNNSGKFSLGVNEIRNDFLRGDEIAKAVRNFRLERVSKLKADLAEFNWRFPQKIVLHLIPLDSLSQKQNTINLPATFADLNLLQPLFYSISSKRYNLDGILAHSDINDREHGANNQFYKNGIIEAVATGPIVPDDGRTKNDIPMPMIEKELIEFLSRAVQFYRKELISSPIALGLSILNVRGFGINLNPHRFIKKEKIDRDDLILQEIVVYDLDTPVDTMLKPVFDQVWNACGYEYALTYSEGKWTDPYRR